MNDVKTEAMNAVDAAWYHMEHPTNLMMVTGFMYFNDPVTRDDILTVLRERLAPFERFHQKVSNHSIRGLQWEMDNTFKIEDHLWEETLDGEGTQKQLQERVGELMSLPLDFNKPLWCGHLIHNVLGGNVFFMRIHHCIADGIAMIGVLLSMTGSNAEESLNLGPLDEKEHHKLNPSGQIIKAAEVAVQNAGKATTKLFDTISKPSKLLDMAKLGAAGAMTTAKLVFKSADPQTVFRGKLGVPKTAVWSQAVSLDDVKAIKNITKSTVNDVLLTAMAGGLRRYILHHGQRADGITFRAAVPVNLRDPSRFKDLGNKFGLVFLDLPVGIDDSLDRLFQLKKNMDQIKNSPEAVIAFGILRAMGMTPAEVQKLISNLFGAKSTCVMTNVPGPKEKLFFAGKQLDNMMFWVPRSGGLGMGISILSYAGEVRLGVATDTGLVPDPEIIIKGFHEELELMMELVRQVED